MKINFKFGRDLTVTEEKILGILSASLPHAKIKVREYTNYCELLVDGVLFTVDYPNKSQPQYIISEGYVIQARSTSLFRATMLIAHVLKP
ncbi:MAG: hypothetical protein ACRDBG_16095 [Waterburya sp.]